MTYSITTNGSASETVTLQYGSNAPYGTFLCGQFSKSPGYTWAFDPTSGPAAAFYTTNGTVMTTPPFSTAQPIELIVNCDTSYEGGLEYFAGTIGGANAAGAYFDVNNGLGDGNDQICQYLTTSTVQSNITAVARISNGYNPWGTQIMSFYAKPALSLSVNLPGGTVGQSYSGTATASAGTTPYTYSSSSLPPGLSISSSSGAISGTPTASGTFPTTITATDSSSPEQTASQTVSVVIAPVVVPTYTIGGTVSGLAGSGLVLQDNGGNNLAVAANGSFTFSTPIATGGAYAVTVLTQPTGPAQTCVVASGSGTVASANVTTVAVSCTTPTYTIGGTVSGLAGTGLVLQDNGGNNLAVAANGSFTFSTPIATGAAYAVTVLSQPAGPVQTCAVASGSGTVASANVTTVAVSCTTPTYTIGGTVSGLASTGLVLQDNGGNNLAVAANGPSPSRRRSPPAARMPSQCSRNRLAPRRPARSQVGAERSPAPMSPVSRSVAPHRPTRSAARSRASPVRAWCSRITAGTI